MLHRPGGKAGIALFQRGDDIAGVMSAWRSFVGMTQAVSAMPAPAEALRKLRYSGLFQMRQVHSTKGNRPVATICLSLGGSAMGGA
ncbi:hypothetical protein [Paracoccus versutus]